MLSKHEELESKLDGAGVNTRAFRSWCEARHPTRSIACGGPDSYYHNGAFVVRHRVDAKEGEHEVTVKRRTSAKSTTARHEVDLHLDHHRTAPADVDAFMVLAGFTKEFVVNKRCHVYWFARGRFRVCVSIYDAWRTWPGPRNRRRFIEVEAEKGSRVTPAAAKREIKRWVAAIRRDFKIRTKPLNRSLYEMYCVREIPVA